jgi:hypothetical protein
VNSIQRGLPWAFGRGRELGGHGLELQGSYQLFVSVNVLQPLELIVCEFIRRHERATQRFGAESDLRERERERLVKIF